MASVAQLRTHIRSVKNTEKITSAMQLVSASKMRRATERSLSTQPYHMEISDLLARLAEQDVARRHPLFEKREVRVKLFIVITSDTGLAGTYNSNVLKVYLQELKIAHEQGVKTQTVAIGRKAIRLATRLGEEVIGTYEGISSGAAANERNAIVSTVVTKYRNGEVDAVDIVYTKYHSPVSQEVEIWKLLPAGQGSKGVLAGRGDGVVSTGRKSEGVSVGRGGEGDGEDGALVKDIVYAFEPSVDEVFEALVKRTIEVQVAQTLFDSVASEHSTRMLTMKNATDNARELGEDLNLAMNRERQAAITSELSDINNGANAVE